MSLNFSALADLEWLLRPDARQSDTGATDAGTSDAGITDERGLGLRLLAQEGLEPGAARRRVDESRGFRRRLALGWLAAIRERRTDLPGERIGRGLTIARGILVIVGWLLGAGVAKALLSYDGSSPVNVLPFVSVFFVLQLVLLLVLLGFVLSVRMPGRGPGLFHRPIAWLTRWLGGRGNDAVAALRTLHTRRGLYADVERWTFFSIAQGVGLAFNAGALLAMLHDVIFTDLTFCWSTTLSAQAESAHEVFRGVALPWLWLPGAVPSFEVVSASQWARMPGEFVTPMPHEQAVVLAAQWWRFLVAGIVCYGLLPRLVALILGLLARRRAYATVGFDHAGFQELFDRLLPRGSGWSSPAPEEVVGRAPARTGAAVAERAPEAPGASVALVVWGSLARSEHAVAAAATRRFGAAPRPVLAAGGASLTADATAIAEVKRAGAARIAVAIAGGHQPTRDVLEFLRRLRAAVSADTPIVVALLDVGAGGVCAGTGEQEGANWRKALAALGDSHLWVDAMEPAS